LHEAAIAAGSTFPLIRKQAIEIAEVLLAASADVNIKNINGDTPLHEAAIHNRSKIAEILLAAGADVNMRNNEARTALDVAKQYASPEDGYAKRPWLQKAIKGVVHE